MVRRELLALGGVALGSAIVGTAVARSRNPTLRIGVSSSQSALDRGGACVANTASSYVQDACVAAWGDEIDPHIGPTNPSVDVPPDVLGDVQDTLSWWQSELRSGTSDRHAHSNLLILSNLETDWGTWWGWADGDDAAVVTGAEQIAAMPTGRQSSPGTAPAVFTNMAIHEVGHNLGLSHGLGERVEVDGEVLNTPMATGSGDPWHDGFLHRFSGQSVLVGPWG